MAGGLEVNNNYKLYKGDIYANNKNSAVSSPSVYNENLNNQLPQDTFQSSAEVNFKGSESETSQKRPHFFQTKEGLLAILVAAATTAVAITCRKQIGDIFGIDKEIAKIGEGAAQNLEKTVNNVTHSGGYNRNSYHSYNTHTSTRDTHGFNTHSKSESHTTGYKPKTKSYKSNNTTAGTDTAKHANHNAGRKSGVTEENINNKKGPLTDDALSNTKEKRIPKNTANSHFCQLSDAENAQLPKELQNTKLGKAFVGSNEKVKGLDYEQSFVFDENGNLLAKSTLNNEFTTKIVGQDLEVVQKCIKNNTPMGHFHQHPYETTFSATDTLNNFITPPNICSRPPYSTMYVKTPNGYAFLQRTKPSTQEEFDYAVKLAEKELLAEIKLARSVDTNHEIVHQLNIFKDKQYKKYASDFKHKYEYVTENFATPKNFQNILDYKGIYNNENLTKMLLSNGRCKNIDEVKVFLNEIDNASLEECLKQL